MSGPVPIHLGLEAHAAVPQPAALTHAVRVVAGAADIKSPDTSRCITFTCSFTMLMIIILGTAVLFFTILTIIMITRVSVFIAGAVMIVTTSINPKPETLNLQDHTIPS